MGAAPKEGEQVCEYKCPGPTGRKGRQPDGVQRGTVVEKLNMENAREENEGGDQASVQSRKESCHLGAGSGQKPEAIQAGAGLGDLSLVLTGHIQQA